MNFTLHLTADCNLDCEYCYLRHDHGRMSEAVALAAVDLCCSYNNKKHGFSLFGGEPLLLRGVIERLTEYASGKDKPFSYKMTTNGTLLDESFMLLAKKRSIGIALSHDGLIQDKKRRTLNGEGTFDLLESKIDLLLAYQPLAVAMQTVTVDTVKDMAESVEWLYHRGFTKINTAIDYRKNAGWDEDNMAELERQYRRIAEFSLEVFESDRPLQYLNFTSKIAAQLFNRGCIECKLGVRQPSIAPDGSIYPCNQFLNLPDYRMGDVFAGIDVKRQAKIYAEGQRPVDSCKDCAIKARCRHACSCLNFSLTGHMDTVSPLQCLHERTLIAAADAFAEHANRLNRSKLLNICGGVEEHDIV